jgi:hypothetical protein
LSQSQILQGQVTALSESCKYENGEPSQGLDHGLECGGNDLKNQQISGRWGFGDGQDALLLPNVAKLQKQLQEVRPN